MTIHDALKYASQKISNRDAKLLLSFITGYSVSGVMLNVSKELTDGESALLRELTERRQTGEPLQYIMGQWEFMGLTLVTDKRALIPRPETELLVEEALEFMRRAPEATPSAHHENSGVFPKPEADKKLRVLDVCTGSGCIALALACLTEAEITASDISAEALSLAQENAEKLGLSQRVSFIQSDLLDAVHGSFDIIISNPPYILSGGIAALEPTVRGYEPHLALDGGADGLDFYRRLIPQSKEILRPGGALFLEIGPTAVLGLMADAGFENINLRRDYAELPRIVWGILPHQ